MVPCRPNLHPTKSQQPNDRVSTQSVRRTDFPCDATGFVCRDDRLRIAWQQPILHGMSVIRKWAKKHLGELL
jgi:hypothetical protein